MSFTTFNQGTSFQIVNIVQSFNTGALQQQTMYTVPAERYADVILMGFTFANNSGQDSWIRVELTAAGLPNGVGNAILKTNQGTSGSCINLKPGLAVANAFTNTTPATSGAPGVFRMTAGQSLIWQRNGVNNFLFAYEIRVIEYTAT